MPQAGKTFRIFVSSTFEDLKEERNALQEKVFPRLRELCSEHGCRFQAIDLRWGVSEEASLDQRTMRICLDELERCQKVTPRPNFVVLLGDRYGWRPLPELLPAGEFERVEELILDASDRELLDIWYERDDNAVPSIYFLKPRKLDIPQGATEEEIERIRENEAKEWRGIEGRLISLLSEAAGRLDLEADGITRYVASATEQEIVNGALEVEDAEEHVFCFFRTIEDLPQDQTAETYININEDGQLDTDAQRRLNGLKERLRARLPENIYQYKADWTGEGITYDHLDKLCDDVYNFLSKVILEQIEGMEKIDDLTREIEEQETFGRERSLHFVGRASMLGTIADYIAGTDPHPLAILGEGGIGKSALVAYATGQARGDHPHAKIVYRSIGATPSSNDGRSLLESLCRHLTRVYGGDEAAVPTMYEDLVDDFPKRLELAGEGEEPLILFLDSLDQLSDAYNSRGLVWLPAELPSNVRIILATRPGGRERHGIELISLRARLPEGNIHELGPMPVEEGEELLEKWLTDDARILQDFQKEEVLSEFTACRNPLYLRMAFEEARRWSSGTKEIDLRPDVEGIIRDLYARLSDEANHGRVLTNRALGYLAASRNGLSEDELLDLFSLDDEVMADFMRRSPRSPEINRLPVVVWSRLYFDLEPYLTERNAEGATLFSFYHTELGVVAKSDYLSGNEGAERHYSLAEYFNLQGDPGGRGFRDEEREGDRWRGSTRALSELPYHVTMAHMWDELFSTLTDFQFLENKAERANLSEFKGAEGDIIKVYGGVFDIQEDYNRALEYFPTS